MTIADEIEHLHVLYEQGVLTHAEFTQAKSAVLGRSAAGSPQPDDHTKALHLEHELARLDREWMLERESYMVTSRYGARSIPSQGGSIVVGVLIGAFGLVWTISAASLGAQHVSSLWCAVYPRWHWQQCAFLHESRRVPARRASVSATTSGGACAVCQCQEQGTAQSVLTLEA